MSILVLILVILLTVGLLPAWPYSATWGYGPSGAMSLVLLGLVTLLRLDDHYSWIRDIDDASEPTLPVDTPVQGTGSRLADEWEAEFIDQTPDHPGTAPVNPVRSLR